VRSASSPCRRVGRRRRGDEPEPGNGELLVDGIARAVAAGVTG
jgi:hypothetical protein